jgi:hypothetical protein
VVAVADLLASMASIGTPAATTPSSGSDVSSDCGGSRGSTERERFQALRRNPFSTRCWTCLWTVATDDSWKWAPISSRLGE